LVLLCPSHALFPLFFFNATATTEIYTLSLHDALPISISFIQSNEISLLIVLLAVVVLAVLLFAVSLLSKVAQIKSNTQTERSPRSEEHTSELQSRENLVCRLLLEKKKNQRKKI